MNRQLYNTVTSVFKTIVKMFFYIIGCWLPVKGTVIFCYHSVGEGISLINLPLDKFREQMEYLKRKGFRAMTHEEFIDCLSNTKVAKEKSFMITFDDGFKDNLINVFPLLSELNFPFIIFLTTNYIGARYEWLTKEIYHHLSVNGDTREENITQEQIEKIRSSEFVRKNMPYLLTFSDKQLMAFLSTLPGLVSQEMLSWDDVKRMSERGVSFGSHSCRHPFLANLTTDDIAQEVSKSKVKIEEIIRKDVSLFCYPYGNYSDKVKDVVLRHGYKAAFVDGMSPCQSFSNRFAIKRVLIHREISFWEFRFYLCRGFNWFIWCRDLLKYTCERGNTDKGWLGISGLSSRPQGK